MEDAMTLRTRMSSHVVFGPKEARHPFHLGQVLTKTLSPHHVTDSESTLTITFPLPPTPSFKPFKLICLDKVVT